MTALASRRHRDPLALEQPRDPLAYKLLVVAGFGLGFIAGLMLAVYNVVTAWLGGGS